MISVSSIPEVKLKQKKSYTGGSRKAQKKVKKVILKVHLLPGIARGLRAASVVLKRSGADRSRRGAVALPGDAAGVGE